MTFAMYLRELRHARQMPPARLADALGIPLKSLIELESGRRLPSVPELRQLAIAFSLAEQELMLRAGYLAPAREGQTAEFEERWDPHRKSFYAVHARLLAGPAEAESTKKRRQIT